MSSASLPVVAEVTHDSGSAVRAVVEHLARSGAVHVRGFSTDVAWWDVLGDSLGAVVPQYHGSVVRHIRPDPQMEVFAVSANNSKELAPHTENFEYPGLPPRYIALYCRLAAETGGETLLYDSSDLLDHLGSDVVDRLMQSTYEWRSPASLASEGVVLSAVHAPVELTGNCVLVRFSAREMYMLDGPRNPEDELLRHYRDEGIRRFTETCSAVSLEASDLLIWDNWRWIHSRNAFVGDRHLERVMFS